ncbi:hypothetical protein CsatA_023190 [Cannabis sativa]
MDDIEGEIEYWNSAIVCYVLGANPPLDVLEGFARRIWKEKVDKVGLLSYGIFLIRFTSVEIRGMCWKLFYQDLRSTHKYVD